MEVLAKHHGLAVMRFASRGADRSVVGGWESAGGLLSCEIKLIPGADRIEVLGKQHDGDRDRARSASAWRSRRTSACVDALNHENRESLEHPWQQMDR